MAVAFTPNIAYPIPGQAIRITFAATLGNCVRVYATDAPPGSKIRQDLDKANARQLLLWEGGASDVWTTQFDVAGNYLLELAEFQKGASSYGGGYRCSPDSFQSETRLWTNSSPTSLAIGRRMTCRVGTSKDSATLVLHVWGGYVRATTLAIHGEKTPALIDPTTTKAANAIQIAAPGGVLEELDALAGVSAATLSGDPAAVLANIAAQHNAHLSHAGHLNADTDNALATSYLAQTAPDRLSEPLAELQRLQDRHCRNDAGGGTGSAADIYHATADWINLPIADPPNTIETNAIALADCWRTHEAHRMQLGGVHSSADTTNVCAPLPPLLHLHKLILAELTKATPSAISTEHPGALTLEIWGLK